MTIPGSRGTPAVLVAHGGLARELKATAESIGGGADSLVCLSNQDKSPETLAEEIGRTLDGLPSDPIVMVDLAGGSCLAAALKACRHRPRVAIVAGVNLPLILDYIQKHDQMPRAELLAHIVDRGHAGLKVVAPGE